MEGYTRLKCRARQSVYARIIHVTQDSHISLQTNRQFKSTAKAQMCDRLKQFTSWFPRCNSYNATGTSRRLFGCRVTLLLHWTSHDPHQDFFHNSLIQRFRLRNQREARSQHRQTPAGGFIGLHFSPSAWRLPPSPY